MPNNWQLSLLLAAKRASALTIHTSQITELLCDAVQHQLRCQQQDHHQQQQQGEEGAYQEFVQEGQAEAMQQLAGMLLGDAQPHTEPDGTTTTASVATSSSRTASATINITTMTIITRTPHTSSSSSGGSSSSRSCPVGAYAPQSVVVPIPIGQQQGPCFKQLSLVGPLSAPALRRFMQLLDVLPGVQQLECISLAADERRDVTSHYHSGWGWDTQDMVTAAAEAPMFAPRRMCSSAPTFSTSSSRSRASTSSQQAGASTSSSSWRSSCHTLLLYDFTGLSNADLGLLVRALPQLRGMRMRHGLACSKPPFAGVLRQLRARHLSHYPYSRDWDVFRLLPSWTNLQHLSLREVNLPLDNSIPPDTCSSLVRLSSLVLNDTDVSNEGLAVLCSATRLKHLELDCTRHVTALPDAISRLTSLKTLIMCGVNILGLPESATALRSLRNLTWCTDGVTAAPRLQLVWELRSLEQLSIAFNTTLSLSSAIGQLTGLRQLHIHGGLEELPVGISRLVGLERITLWSSSLRELPSSITALTRLSCIRLHCSQLQDLPPPVQAFVQPRQQLLGPFGWA